MLQTLWVMQFSWAIDKALLASVALQLPSSFGLQPPWLLCHSLGRLCFMQPHELGTNHSSAWAVLPLHAFLVTLKMFICQISHHCFGEVFADL